MTDATGTVLQEALDLARDNGHSAAESLHLANILFGKDDSIGARVVSKIDTADNYSNPHRITDINQVRRSLQKLLIEKPSQSPPPLEASISLNLSYLLQRATKTSKANGDALVALDHLLFELFPCSMQ